MSDATISLPEQLPATGPYKGLANYTEEDAAFFFGRDREREVIIANLKARRLTLLYGESGVGKSSLLRAGVVADLLAQAHETMDELGTPEYLPVVYSSWRDDPVAGLIDAIDAALERVTGRPAGLSPSLGLEGAIREAARAADAYLLIILDQFEEYFLYHSDEEPSEAFAEQFPRAINRRGLQAGFLVAIREDALAKLDRFKGEIPKLFDTFLRIDHLDAAAAHEAIVGPVEEYNRRAPEDRRVWLDPLLIDTVLNQVRTGQVVLEQAGHGTVQSAGPIAWADDRIETPYLQLVMARLWDEERRHGSLELHLATLDALGGAQEIVRTHLDAALSTFTPAERDVVADLFHHLVTPSGTKIAHGAGDLAEYVRRPEAEVAALLEKLAARETRIVRAVPPPPGEDRPPRYEIFHDVLAPSVLDWRSRQTAARRAQEERRAARAARRRRLFWLGGGLGLALFGLIVWLAIEANSQRDAAQTSARHAASLARMADAQRQSANHQKNLAVKARIAANQQRLIAIKADAAAKRAEAAVRKENGRLTGQTAQLRTANQHALALSSSLAVQDQRLRVNQRSLVNANKQTAAVAHLKNTLYDELVGLAKIRFAYGVYSGGTGGGLGGCCATVRGATDAASAVASGSRSSWTPAAGAADTKRISSFTVGLVPPGARLTVSCQTFCLPFDHTSSSARTESVLDPNLAGVSTRATITVVVKLHDVARTIVVILSSRSQTGSYCRPAGSRVLPSAIPATCT